MPLAVTASVVAKSDAIFISSLLNQDLHENRKRLTQQDKICIYICNKDPSEGGTYCGCDALPLNR
jgi:hypothetical protein